MVAVRRAKVHHEATRCEDEVELAQPLTQEFPFLRRVGGVRHLDVVADDHIRSRTGEIGTDPTSQKRRIAADTPTANGELIRGPALGSALQQPAREPVALEDAAHVARHLGRKRLVSGHNEDAQIGIPVEEPGAIERSERRLARAAEEQEKQPALTVAPLFVEPLADLQMEQRRAQALIAVPKPHEAVERERATGRRRSAGRCAPAPWGRKQDHGSLEQAASFGAPAVHEPRRELEQAQRRILKQAARPAGGMTRAHELDARPRFPVLGFAQRAALLLEAAQDGIEGAARGRDPKRPGAGALLREPARQRRLLAAALFGFRELDAADFGAALRL